LKANEHNFFRLLGFACNEKSRDIQLHFLMVCTTTSLWLSTLASFTCMEASNFEQLLQGHNRFLHINHDPTGLPSQPSIVDPH
jgi:hypothetical protein